MRFAFLSSAALAATLLSGCAVGPDFERPPPPNVKTYEAAPLPSTTVAVTPPKTDATPLPQKAEPEKIEPAPATITPAPEQAPPMPSAASETPVEKTEAAPQIASATIEGGAAQAFVVGQEIPAGWWVLFHSEPLDSLIKKSLAANPDIAAAAAALKEAHENTLAGTGALLPSVDAGAGVEREKISGVGFGSTASFPPFTLYNATVSVSYSLDLWGGTRRQIEALGAEEDYQRFALEAARTSLAANVVTAAVAEASLRGQIDATNKIIEAEKSELDLAQKQLELGGIAATPVLAQQAQLSATQATLPPLEKQLALVRHQLSVFAGDFPSEEPAAKFELSSLTLPEELPVSLPSKLVEQRPDIRAAEAVLHAASAEVGVATAAMLPQITLSADIGEEAGSIGKFFSPGTGIWALAAGASQPIFHGGTLFHQRRAAEAAYDQAAAQYKKTVLAAFQDVADTLRALQSDAEALKASAAAEQAAADSLALVQHQYELGAVSYLELLNAQQVEQQARLVLVAAEARRFADTAALFTALGGGWWNVPPSAATPVAASGDDDGLQAPIPAAAPADPVQKENEQ